MRRADRRHRPDGTFDVVIPETEHEAIYRAWRQGESQHAIAARYGVWHTTIAWICNRFVTRHPERACDIAILEAPRQYAGRVQIAANNMVTERDWALSIQWRHEPWLPGYPAYEQYQRVAAAWRAGELDITEPLAAD